MDARFHVKLMENKLDTRRILIFLAFAFGIAWAAAAVIYLNGQLNNSPVIFQIGGANVTLALVLEAGVYMWAPALAHILTRVITREGWRDTRLALNFRSWKYWFAAWVLPGVLTILGMGIYFAIFPGHLDLQLGALQQMIASTGQTIPLSPWAIVGIQVAQALLLAPLINSLFTFGEEFGWRGYLQPKLMNLGFRPAMLWMGVIWGVWHWPIIAMGHNYGLDYWGYPWTGMLAMAWFTLCVGTVIGYWSLRSNNIWPAVLGHAAVNGIAGLGVLFVLPGTQPNPLLGPLPVGLIGGIPWALLAAYFFWKGDSGTADVSRETQAVPGTPPAKGIAISTQGLTKFFGDVHAVEGLDLEIPTGEVFGLLGPNGAGKTTTIRMLSALIAPTSGAAWVAGHQIGFDDTQVRRHVGILTETPGMYEQLSAERNLEFFAQMYDVPNVDQQVKRYLQMLGLYSRRNEPVGTFSKGMRQKLAIARALLHEPQVLYLDEPTSGLDPEAARLVREFVSELKSEGRTIVLTTHNLDEADRLCDRIAVFKGRLLALDTPTNLRRKLFGRAVVFHLAANKPAFASALRQKDFVHDVESVDSKLVVRLDDPESQNPELVRTLVDKGAEVQFVGEMRQSLEDVYLQLIENES